MATQVMTRASAIPSVRKPQSLWSDALRRLLRNRAAMVGLGVIVALLLTYVLADVVALRPYDMQVPDENNAMPQWLASLLSVDYARISSAYPLGADNLGRDLFSRVVYGTRVSLTVALVGPFIAILIGTVYGSISGFFGGRLDNVMMRFVDVMYAFPSLLLIILMMAFFRSSFAGTSEPGTIKYALNMLDSKVGGMLFIFIGIGVTAWMGMARLARAQVLSLRQKEFVEAARAVGATNLRIMVRHLLPNILGPLIVAETLAIPGYIATETFLSFIGLGVNPPTPSWGSMIAEGSNALRTYPHQALVPGLALAVTMFAFNFLGDGLRDALDPRSRNVS